MGFSRSGKPNSVLDETSQHGPLGTYSGFSHLNAMRFLVIQVHVILGIPILQRFIQAVEPTLTSAHRACAKSYTTMNSPVCGSRQICNLLSRNILWNKRWNGVTDEHVRLLYFRPQMVPDILLRGAGRLAQVAADLDMTPVKHGPIWSEKLYEWDQAGHLGVVDLIMLAWRGK